jgi:hypothetical protein
MSEVSPGSPGTPASNGHQEPSARLPLRQAVIEEAAGRLPAGQVVQLTVTGDRPVINYISQDAAGGTNFTVAGGAAAGQVGRGAGTAGRDAAVPGVGDQPVEEGWWSRLRKRGAVVAFATIVGALASVAGVVVSVMVAVGWTP